MAGKTKSCPKIRDVLTEMLNNGELERIITEGKMIYITDLTYYLDTKKIASPPSFYNWKMKLGKEDLERFERFFTRACEEEANRIIGAMRKNAQGFEYEETEQEIIINPLTGEQRAGKVRKIKRYKAPDLQSQKILMTNLTKKINKNAPNADVVQWTNSTEVIEIKTDGGLNLTLDKSIQEILKEINEDK